MTAEPVEDAAVMAEHQQHGRGYGLPRCVIGGGGHCKPYRLAEALAASEAKVARVEALAKQYADFADSVPDQFVARVARDVSRAYLASLADQPNPPA